MEWLKKFVDLFLHLDTHLADMVHQYGPWIYAILFLIVFCETGLVVTPILPGDSLLFAAGALVATGNGELNFLYVCLVLLVAAILGDTVNYWIGRGAGYELLKKFPRLIRQQHIDKTHEFFERYGGKTVIMARFVPIVRTFAPFVAGIGKMTYARFMAYNVVGAILWVFLLVPAGYFFANVPFVKKNFTAVVLGIVFVSILPALIEIWRQYRGQSKAGDKQ